MAYASLTVNVGSFNDPLHRQGLAHLVEHMVFRGSKKYPISKTYDEHLTKHGGMCNAYTEPEKTTFYFEVQYTGLKKALNIMGNQLSEPLFNKDAIDGEVDAIDEEYKMRLNNDSVCYSQSLCDECNTGNLFNRFRWGSKESLTKEKPQ